ncbi:haloacid dehalogenase-like hydrolase [Edaphobacter paludis]|uniref:Haloacid dehalogenase-like hydrolase n=1 Tax=Edaphobacter paludis TaxID=3035702 RepID=A0AAU7CTV3_9BACT
MNNPSSTLLANRLSTAEFHAAVYELSPTVAVFDCDGTLWSGDAGSSFMKWTIDTGLISREATDWIDGRYRGYKRGEVSELAICGEMVQLYQGLREEEMRRAAKKFFATHIEPNIFPEMLELVTELQRKGVDIWAVSSTCDWVIEEGVQRFKIPANRVLAARVTIKDGLVTETICDVPTDEGKVTSLARVGITTPEAVFGNSVHDAAMLGIAGRAFPVNPSPALAEHSAAEGWPVYYPASVVPIGY